MGDDDAEVAGQFSDTDFVQMLEIGHCILICAYAMAMNSFSLGVGLRQSVEEIDDAGLQGVLGADDHESGLLDELLNDVRAVPQVLHRRLDIGANRRTARRSCLSSVASRLSTDGRIKSTMECKLRD